jgi:hypothetical protein
MKLGDAMSINRDERVVDRELLDYVRSERLGADLERLDGGGHCSDPPRQRNGMSSPVAQIPWISIVALILALATIASIAWAGWAETRADAAYERGRAEQREEQAERAIMLLEKESRLREEAECIAAEKEALADDVITEVHQVLSETSLHIDGLHIADALEVLIGVEEVVLALANSDPSLIGHYSEERRAALLAVGDIIYRDKEACSAFREGVEGAERAWQTTHGKGVPE